MLKKLCFVIAILMAATFLLTSCQKEETVKKDDMYSFTDSVGNTIEVETAPKKVAVLFSSFADIWVTAGGSVDITVGEAIERGFADNNAILVDTGAGKSIDTEALIAAKPDFVICSADIQAQAETAQLLHSVNIPCAEFRVESFKDYIEVLKICTDITGNYDAYIKYGVEVEEKIAAILEKIPDATEAKKILFIRSGSGESSAKAKTADQHFAAAMLEELGAYNIADNAPILLDGLSVEEIISEDPEMIFITTMGEEQAAKLYMDGVLNSEIWKTLTAVKNNNYFYLPKDLFQFKPNARWDEAYHYLAGILYQDVDF